MRLYKISISIIKNKVIFNNKILTFIAFSIIIYFLSLHLTIYLIYSILVVTLIEKKNLKIEEESVS